jgi:DUF1680 family protein
VNLLLNRVSPWIDVASHLPFEGKVEIRVHDAERVRVRIPDWVDKAKVRAEVNAKGVEPAWSARYLGLEKLKRAMW